MKAGVIGIGTMGKELASILHRKTWLTGIFDLKEVLCPQYEWMNALWKPLPELIESSDYLLLCLPDKQASIHTIDIILENEHLPQYVFDFTTATPDSAKENHHKCSAVGVKYFECPMIGGVRAAKNGKLKFITGCDEENFPIAVAMLNELGSEAIYAGACGSATTVKLIHNMVTVGTSVINMEAILLAEKFNINRNLLFEVLQKGTASSYVIFNTLERTLLRGSFEEGYKTMHVAKDMHSVMDLIEEKKLKLECFQSVYEAVMESSTAQNAEIDYPIIYNNLKDSSEKNGKLQNKSDH